VVVPISPGCRPTAAASLPQSMLGEPLTLMEPEPGGTGKCPTVFESGWKSLECALENVPLQGNPFPI